jgi:hypothetical protein
MKLRSIFFILFLFVGSISFGQPNNPGGDPDTVPITGIELLVGAGALLGAKRILDKRRK